MRFSRHRAGMVSASFVVLAALLAPVGASSVAGTAAAADEIIFESPYDSSFVAKVQEVSQDKAAAISFSNNYVGNRQVDPLISPGAAQSHHMHGFVGTRLRADADLDRLFDEPRDWEAGTNGVERNSGFAAEIIKDGRRSGYTPGIWFPVIWDAPPGREPVPVVYKDGISSYYLHAPEHGDEYLQALPNGMSYLVTDSTMHWNDQAKGTFQVNYFGPKWWDGENLASGDHMSHVSRQRSPTHDVAIPEFQTYIKAEIHYTDDPTPLAQRLKFGNPGRWVGPHLDYVAGFREPWYHQWLLDLGPNWGHPQNVLRKCGVDMPSSLQRRKLEGIRMPQAAANQNGVKACSWNRPTTAAPDRPAPIGGGGASGTGPSVGGYWLLERDGDVHAFGTARDFGDIELPSGVTAVDIVARPQADGFWVLLSNGVIHARGAAAPFARVNPARLTKRGENVASMSATPDGDGLWTFTTAGRIIDQGSAAKASAMSGASDILDLDLDGPVVSSVATPAGNGAYMVASDGGVFAVGDARFVDSVRGQLTKLHGPPGLPDLPITGVVADPDGTGYWMVARDGGVFAFDAAFRGSLPAIVAYPDMDAPIAGMVPYGSGYLLIGEDGGVFTFSDLPFEGSAHGQADTPVVGIATGNSAGLAAQASALVCTVPSAQPLGTAEIDTSGTAEA